MNHRVFVPTLVDADNINPQVNNARAILAGWDLPGWRVAAHAYHKPDQRVIANTQIDVTKLWRRRAWLLHLFLRYLKPYDLIFYPGVYPQDAAGLLWRQRLGLSAPIVATLEGLVGNSSRETEYSARAGHPVFCQHVSDDVLKRLDKLYHRSNHIIAISPFLAKMGQSRFGNKFSVLPLGIDVTHYYATARHQKKRLKVVSAGGVRSHKRPELFLELARRYPHTDFVWYGEGDMRTALLASASQLGLSNLSYPGALQPNQLGEAFRAADIFVMPSVSEGVPKVTQEAAACGLAQVIFGYYEAPSVVHGQNGFVVWTDDAFVDKIGELIDNPALVQAFGQCGAEMALAWDWTIVARRWRERLLEVVDMQCVTV